MPQAGIGAVVCRQSLSRLWASSADTRPDTGHATERPRVSESSRSVTLNPVWQEKLRRIWARRVIVAREPSRRIRARDGLVPDSAGGAATGAGGLAGTMIAGGGPVAPAAGLVMSAGGAIGAVAGAGRPWS
ncbi:MAG: hypothetical protein V7607_1691 [Solirubrobacteraceae bacterium]